VRNVTFCADATTASKRESEAEVRTRIVGSRKVVKRRRRGRDVRRGGGDAGLKGFIVNCRWHDGIIRESRWDPAPFLS